MGVSYSELVLRFKRDFVLYGLPDDESIKDIIVFGVNKYISYMDFPVISDTISVTTGTQTYSIPNTIKKLQDIRNSDGDSVVYSEDVTKSEVTFQNSVTTGIYTAYGTPENVRTNIETVVLAIPEEQDYVMWNFVGAFAAKWAKDDMWINELKVAEDVARSERRSINRRLDISQLTFKTKDVRGYNINDSANAEGVKVDIDGQFASDL